jgi:hypothetical protein
MRSRLIPTTTPVSTGRAAARGLVRVAHRAGAAFREMNYAASRVAWPRVTGR